MTIAKQRKRSPSLPNTTPLVIRLQLDEVARAEECAGLDNRSRASFIRLMFLHGLNDFERKKGISSKTK